MSDGTEATPRYRYDAKLANDLELEWQDRWEREQTFATPNPVGELSEGFERFEDRPKFFVMDMFPYPSGAGLHVGHPLGYIGTDVFARFLRMTGHHVLHPFGYDAFGLPAEQYAIDTGQHPAVTTAANIANMQRQLRRLGLGHDSRREFSTTDVSYYRWTQWIFLKIFNSWYDERAGRARPIDELVRELEAGERQPHSSSNQENKSWRELTDIERRRIIDDHRLAYISEELVNWCPGLGTVLANEEITADGRSDIGNYPVYRRPLRQWMLRISAYAERLIEELDLIEWPESIKQMQRNWIGRSDGANIELPVAGQVETRIEVFTTRPDTLPGATYLVLAPEHPLVEQLITADWPAGTPEVWMNPDGRGESYDSAHWTPVAAVRTYQEVASRLSDRDRTTDLTAKTGVFTGSYAVNPVTDELIPIFVADYVLMGYGTGAIQAVPAHDERDLEFARTYGLPVRAVLRPTDEWFDRHQLTTDASVGDWPAAFVGEGAYEDLKESALSLVGLAKVEAIEETIRWVEEHGCGGHARSYRLRDWLFSRQRYWGEPFPIVYDEDGMSVALPESMLPVTLPDMSDFRPQPQQDETSEPVPPLARATGWIDVELDLGDGPKKYRRELNTMPQWAGSCWYYLRYLDPRTEHALVDPEVERYWMLPSGATESTGGVDLYVGGVEHAVLHLLYARFWHKVLNDLGYVSTKEPFRRLFNQGYILADAFLNERGMYVSAAEVIESADGTLSYRGQPVTRRAGKMGKSLKNSVSPDDIYSSYGADTLRLYEMAMGPLDADRPWRMHDIIGVHRFLQRLWRNLVDESTGRLLVDETVLDEETKRRLHRTIEVVRRDYGDMRFNIVVARLIELNNHASKLAIKNGQLPRELAEPLVLMLAPLAPHIAEELWRRLGHSESLTYAPFPVHDPDWATDPTLTVAVQFNGKTRYTVDVPAEASNEEVQSIATQHPAYVRHVEGRSIRKVIVVPGKVVNVVVG